MGTWDKLTIYRPQHEEKCDATFVSTPFKLPAIADAILNTKDVKWSKALEKHLENLQNDAYMQKRGVITNLIKADNAAPKNIDPDNMADMILSAAQETGVDPIVIASIAKRETHFNQNVPTKCGSGIMQLTSISVKDMFQRPQIYDPALKPLMKKYGTLEKLLKAKEKDPSIDLGKFGDMLAEYGNCANLLKAIRKDPALNIKAGAYLYKSKLAQAKGNEQRALELYNGSPAKESYAKDVIANITRLRQENVSFDSMA